jgi:site-specific recombinase XerD
MDTFSIVYGLGWGPVTRRKHADDFARFCRWLEANGLPATVDALDYLTLARYVQDLRTRPLIHGVWRGAPDALERSLERHPQRTLSANSVNSYVRPLRSLALWLVDEGYLTVNPFRKARHHAAAKALLPSEETPTKSATLADLRLLERGCAGDSPLDLRDQAIFAILKTTAARNSSVRLLTMSDIDYERDLILFRRAKGAKTLEIALHPSARAALLRYVERGRPALVIGPSAGATPAGSEPLFVSTSRRAVPTPLSMNALSGMLTRRYRQGGGTLPYFGSHRIRHATATLLVNNGMPLEEVSRYLGHSSTVPTRRYARHTLAPSASVQPRRWPRLV